MKPLSTLIIGGLTITAAVVSYLLAHNVILAVLVFLAVYLICRNLQPFISQKWMQFQISRLPELHELRAKNLSPQSGSQGMRLLAMTEYLEPGQANRPVYKEIAGAALEALASESPLFALRLNTVRQEGLPEQFVCALCGQDGKRMRKCVKAWAYSDALWNMRPKKQNQDLFIYDGAIDIPGQEEPAAYTVIVLFDDSLPAQTTTIES